MINKKNLSEQKLKYPDRFLKTLITELLVNVKDSLIAEFNEYYN